MIKMYKPFFTVFFIVLTNLAVQAQKAFFSDFNESAIQLGNAKRVIIPQKFRSIRLNNNDLKDFLWSLPSEKNIPDKKQTPILELPTPDGKMARFHVWESSIQEPGLEAKFPEIKTFTGQGIDDPYATIRLDYSPYGFHAQVLSINGTYYIDPYARGMADNYISYYRKDFRKTGTMFCEVPDNTAPVPPINNVVTAQCLGTDLRTYRLAVACTGEYAQAPGITAGTNPAILHAAIVTTVNRVVGVYEKEVSIRMILVANNNLIEFLDAASDPFNGNNNANVLINESQTVIDANILPANYDIGHTFSTGGGGLAQLNSPCGTGKARGITGSPFPTGDGYDIDYVAHEMGHQFGGNHSMAGCGSSPTSTKYEVGSGTTIQAYAGICGAENIQPNSDPFFHAISFDEISNFVTGGGGSTCGTTAVTGNTLPVIAPLPNNNLNIPPGTPFTLTGSATDADGDPLTYCWEQWDFSGTATWNAGVTAPVGNSVPLFKSRIPKTTGSRTFPDMAVILANYPANPPSAMAGLKGETLSPVARAMKFRLTVRDNRAAGGGVVSSGSGCQGTGVFQVNVVGSTPFTVSSPNGGETWAGGTAQTFTWNTAGTENAPVSAANVKISLSTDGGLTYPTVITASTPNDGTELLTLPPGATTTARIKVEGVGNIFFDISNANFTITASAVGFDFSNPAAATVSCAAAASAAVTLGTTSNGGYVIPINLSATGNPVGTTVSFSVNPLVPGNNTVVTLNNINTLTAGTYNIVVTGISGTITQTRTISFIITPGTGPAISAQPTGQNACIGTAASFSVTAATATGYQWQISTNGGGTWTNIVAATGATYTIASVTLIQNNYQYRCIVNGQCNTTTSAAAVLTINTAPAFTQQPASNSVCAGNSISFTVAASGAAPGYQWQVSTDGGVTFNTVGGATAATYSFVSLLTQNGYQYRCVVTGTCAPSITSTAATLTVGSTLIINSQPTQSIICAGGTATFNVAVTGTVTYQWEESTNGGGTWTGIINGGIYSGATAATLTLTGVPATANNNLYRCIVSGNCPSINSLSAALTVNTAPAITAQPVLASIICATQNTSFSVTANGTALAYQWQVSTDAGVTYSNLANAGFYSNVTTATLNITAATVALNAYKYRCIISGTCAPSATTAVSTLTVYTPVSISSNPTTATLCENSNASFSITAAGTTPTYQWQVSVDGGATYNNVINGGVYSGAATATLSLTGVGFNINGSLYRCIVSGAAPCGVINSSAASLNINPAPAQFTVTGGGAYCLGSNGVPVGLSNSSTGIRYQLLLNGVNTGTPLAGTGIAINFGNKTVAGNYTVLATNATTGCTKMMAGSVTVVINPLPTIALTVAPYKNLYPGLITTLTATATTTAVPANINYLWFKNNAFINNSGNTLAVSINNPIANLGDYMVIISDANGCINQSQVIRIADSANNKLFIYPSPNDGQFTIAYHNAGASGTKQIITIYSSKGEKVYNKEFPVNVAYELLSIDLRRNGAGIYYVMLSDATGKRIKTSEVLVR
jgi:Metallo-peptidase family M12B Reprolysin-like/Secretion system C-terminal sorting domain